MSSSLNNKTSYWIRGRQQTLRYCPNGIQFQMESPVKLLSVYLSPIQKTKPRPPFYWSVGVWLMYKNAFCVHFLSQIE